MKRKMRSQRERWLAAVLLPLLFGVTVLLLWSTMERLPTAPNPNASAFAVEPVATSKSDYHRLTQRFEEFYEADFRFPGRSIDKVYAEILPSLGLDPAVETNLLELLAYEPSVVSGPYEYPKSTFSINIDHGMRPTEPAMHAEKYVAALRSDVTMLIGEEAHQRLRAFEDKHFARAALWKLEFLLRNKQPVRSDQRQQLLEIFDRHEPESHRSHTEQVFYRQYPRPLRPDTVAIYCEALQKDLAEVLWRKQFKEVQKYFEHTVERAEQESAVHYEPRGFLPF